MLPGGTDVSQVLLGIEQSPLDLRILLGFFGYAKEFPGSIHCTGHQSLGSSTRNWLQDIGKISACSDCYFVKVAKWEATSSDSPMPLDLRRKATPVEVPFQRFLPPSESQRVGRPHQAVQLPGANEFLANWT